MSIPIVSCSWVYHLKIVREHTPMPVVRDCDKAGVIDCLFYRANCQMNRKWLFCPRQFCAIFGRGEREIKSPMSPWLTHKVRVTWMTGLENVGFRVAFQGHLVAAPDFLSSLGLIVLEYCLDLVSWCCLAYLSLLAVVGSAAMLYLTDLASHYVW